MTKLHGGEVWCKHEVCFYFANILTCTLVSLAKLSAIQRMKSPPGIGLNRWHCEFCDSHQYPLPKKWTCLQKVELNDSKPFLVSQHNHLSFQKSPSSMSALQPPASVRKNGWLARDHPSGQSFTCPSVQGMGSFSSFSSSHRPCSPQGLLILNYTDTGRVLAWLPH